MLDTQTSPTEIQANLDQFHGSEQFVVHGLGRFLMTEGVIYLREAAGAFWLIDAIASYVRTSPRVREEEFQVWKLVRDAEGHGAVLTMTDGNTDAPIVRQVIEFTDFPLPAVTFWLENNVLMLPGER